MTDQGYIEQIQAQWGIELKQAPNGLYRAHKNGIQQVYSGFRIVNEPEIWQRMFRFLDKFAPGWNDLETKEPLENAFDYK